jgi:hypothetical protein
VADKKPSGNQKPARKKAPLKNLTRSSQELSKDQAKAVKGGAVDAFIWFEQSGVKGKAH